MDNIPIQEMINNILKMDEKDAKDIMTHRKHIVAVDGDMTLEEAAGFMLEQNYSRFPVFDGDIDNLVGTLHIRDAFAAYRDHELRALPVKEQKKLLRELKYIPETRNIYRLFRQMQASKTHMVIVSDEYGQTAGLIAMEDILEEIVGNILDEYDQEERDIILTNDGNYVIRGMTALEDVEEVLGIDFEDEENETLGGFLIAQLDHIPKEGAKEEVTFADYRFRILTITDQAIEKVLITREPKTE